MTISHIEPVTWSFMNKYFTYDNEDGSASNAVVCPLCAPKFENDPSARPLTDQTPDPTLKCVVCDKPWVSVESESKPIVKCPECGSLDIGSGFIESVPGYGAGPNFKSCEDCGHNFDYD